MTDIFNEVDEEVRRDQIKKLWDRYGILIIILAVIVVAGVAAWRGYEYVEAKKAAEAGTAFEQAMTLADDGKHQDAEAAFAKIASDSPSGYRTLARLSAASELGQRDPKAGVAEYDMIAADKAVGAKFKELATLRAGFLLLDTAPFDEIVRRIEPISGPSATFRHSARELLALAAWRAGDKAAAQRWAQLIMNDGEAPSTLRSRIEMLLALTGATGKG